MEVKKNYPSLPSNYVTLADLQQRWRKEQEDKKNKEKQLEEQQKQQQQQQMLQHHNLQEQDPHRPGDEEVKVVVQRHGTDSRSATPNHRAKQYRRKIRSGSRSNPPAIKLKAEDHPKVETNAGIGEGNADLESKGNKSTKKNKKTTRRRKPWGKKEGRGTTMEGNKEAENSDTKSGDDQKTTIKRESNDKSGKSSTTEVEVEQKFGALSMNSGNGRLRRVPDGFHNSQYQRRNNGGRGHGHGHGGGSHFHRPRQDVQKRRGDKLIWVRKDGNVGGIKTSPASYA